MSGFQYFDLQVNGYAGVDFNQDKLTGEALHGACSRLRRDGTRILATIISEDLERMCGRLRRLRLLRDQDALAREVIAGFHVEGPFISDVEGFCGAHPRDAVRPANIDTAKELVDAAGGLLRVFTLAPEHDPACRVTRFLAAQGIVVSAGHTDASLEQLEAAVDAGLTMVTHFGNGCPMKLHRHDNILHRMLHLSDRLWICFIGDGHHLPIVALSNYLRLVGIDRSIMVTDAMAAAGLSPGRFRIGRWDVLVGEDKVARAPDGSHFLGAAATMPEIDQNLRDRLTLSADDWSQLFWHNPSRAMTKSCGW